MGDPAPIYVSRLALGLSLLIGFVVSPALAHRDDYLNETFVFQTLQAGEFEPELFLDYGPRSDGRDAFVAYAAAFEYGVTEHWMVDAFVGWFDPGDGPLAFQRFREETRLRFGEEGDRPVDVAASFEVEYERESEEFEEATAGPQKTEEEYVLTPRLVLSRDLGQEFNVTLNIDLAREIRRHRGDRWTPGYALGVRYPREALFRYGVELRQDFGDERDSILIPQVWVSLPRDATFKLGGGLDLDGPSRKHFWRVVFEIEF